jgi:DNA-binding response OmpR family regulator
MIRSGAGTEQLARQLSVAVVEDNPHIRQLLQDEIHDEGHRMIGFSSAEDFLATYGEEPIDLILLDLMLPGMDGLSCLQQLKINQSQDGCPRVVIVTALDDAEKRRIALDNGAEEYILKPDLFLRLPDLLQSETTATEEARRHP